MIKLDNISLKVERSLLCYCHPLCLICSPIFHHLSHPFEIYNVRSYQRSHSESVYTVPAHTEQTFLQASHEGQQGLVPGPFRGPHGQDPALQWSRQTSRQTSLDTSYNVPSIRSELAETRQLGRFDSIAEVTESLTPSVRR